MRLDFDLMRRMHRDEITPREAFDMQRGREGADTAPGPVAIPRRLHFVWLGRDTRLAFHLRGTVASLYPGWRVTVWSAPPADWPEPWARLYARCPDNARRADVLRVWALLTQGGMYADQDFVGVRPLPAEHLSHPFAAACLDGRPANGLMASVPHGETIARYADALLDADPTRWTALGADILSRLQPFPTIPEAAVFPLAAKRDDWTTAWDYAWHAPKPPGVCMVHLWLGGRRWGEAARMFAELPRTACASVSRSVLTGRALQSMRTACIQQGLPLRGFLARSTWGARHQQARNFITWGMKRGKAEYEAGGKNILYVENGLLGQRSGFYIDHRGYFSDSSIRAEPQPAPAAAEVAALHAHVRRTFGWDWWAGGDPDGPVLVALQQPGDVALSPRYYPAGGARPNERTLAACRQHLPAGVPVVVRRHPRDRSEPPELPEGYAWDTARDPCDSLRRCRALATANSTMATEALCLGLPVAVLGKGAFTGSGTMLECHADAARLSGLPGWQPEEWPCLVYLCAVLRHQLRYSASLADVLACPSFRVWLDRAGRAAPATLDERFEAAAAAIDQRGSPAQREQLAAIRRALATCPTCSRDRLKQRAIALAGNG